MPSSYPPRSYQQQQHSQQQSYQQAQQHATRNRRSHSSNRDRRNVQHHPFAGQQHADRPEKRFVKLRAHFVAMVSEFVGTTMFLWFAFAGTQAAAQINPTPEGAQSAGRLTMVCLSFGFSLMVVVWAHYRISGGLFNPAVTLALCMTKNVDWTRGLLLLPAQLLGGIVAAALVSCMLPGDLAVVATLSVGTTITQGIFIEAFGTMLLITVILFLAAEKHETTPFAPIGIGLALFVAELGTVLYTGGAINPARAFGPSVVVRDFPGYHYIYWIGPIIGAFMASAYYGFCHLFNYWEANPGQDSKGPDSG